MISFNKSNMQKLEYVNERKTLAAVAPIHTPFVVHIDVCGRCNFKCVFCPSNSSAYQASERHTMMDYSTFEKVASDLEGFDEQVKVACLYCFGEPMLNPHLPEMASLLKRRKIVRDVRVTTNGSLLNTSINSKLIESGIDLIRISIEALTSEAYYQITKIPFSYEKLLSNIKDLYKQSRGTNTKISVKLITTGLNYDSEQIFAETFHSISDSYFIEEQGNIWPMFDVETVPRDFAIKKDFESNRDTQEIVCSYPFTYLVVCSDGKVVACCLDWRRDTFLGNVSKETLREIWEGDKLREFRLKHLNAKRGELPSCNVCRARSPDIITFDDAEKILERMK